MAKKKQKNWVDIVDPLECKAKEVLKCPYHGPGSLVLQACPPGYGHLKAKFKVAKVDHGWEVTVPNGIPYEESFKKLSKLVNNSHGGTLFTLSKAGAGIIKVEFKDGGFELPPEEKHLMEADTLSPETAPSGGEDLLSSEKNIDDLDVEEFDQELQAALAEADELINELAGIEPSVEEFDQELQAALAEADELINELAGIEPSVDAGAPAEMLSNQSGQDVDTGGSTGTDNQQKPPKKGSPAKPPAGVLAPLEHDETKFPKNVTQKKLEAALAAPESKPLGGASGEHATLVFIDGRKYVLKSGTGSHAEHLANEAAADMAYRAGGIRAPDCAVYNFGGKAYKLAEFIEGESLYDYMASATEEQKDKVRRDLLQGFPLDVLFSNWDVLGANRDNVMVDKDGNCWRIDNGGSFFMAAMSNEKSLNWAINNLEKPYTNKGKPPLAVFEHWDDWGDRKWIDDFRTMRVGGIYKGVFDGYSTADIFLAAGNIDLGKAVDSIKDEKVRAALRKPLFEMKNMASHAVSAELSGYTSNSMLSISLDAMYNASKEKFRELCVAEVKKLVGGGYGEVSDSDTAYQMQEYPVKKPEKPVSPEEKHSKPRLANSEYSDGTRVADIIIALVRSMNYHMGYQLKDRNGKPIGTTMSNPDFKPNGQKLEAFNKIDREKLAHLAEKDKGAETALAMYDAAKSSIESGCNIPLPYMTAVEISAEIEPGYKTSEEKEFEQHLEAANKKYKQELKAWKEVLVPEWEKGKAAWTKAENEKMAKSGTKRYKTFWDHADAIARANCDTFGVAHNNGDGLRLMEEARCQNKYGTNTKNCSWMEWPCRTKVLDLMYRGMSLPEIMTIKDDDPLVNNGHYSNKKAKKDFRDAAKFYFTMPNTLKADMQTFSVFKGLQTLKLGSEHGSVYIDGEKHNVYNQASKSVLLGRADAGVPEQTFAAVGIKQQAAVASCCYMEIGALNLNPYLYDVPFWAVSYTYSDSNMTTSIFPSYKGSEHEWVATLIGLRPFSTTFNMGFSGTVKKALESELFTADRKKREARLAPFATSIEELMSFA